GSNPQGSSCLPTLGFASESHWDSRMHFWQGGQSSAGRSPQANLGAPYLTCRDGAGRLTEESPSEKESASHGTADFTPGFSLCSSMPSKSRNLFARLCS